MGLRIVLFEDQHLLSESMATTLNARIGAEILGTFATVAEVLKSASILRRAQLALVDIRLGDMEAFEMVGMLRTNYPDMKLIWVTSMTGDYLLQRATEAQFPGFVHKDDPLEVLLTAIKTVMAGGVYVSESILQAQAKLRANQTNFHRLLSIREQEVMCYLGSGYTNAEVATLLGLSEGTIHSHRRNIMAKLELHTAAELVMYAVRHGFVDPKSIKPSGRLPAGR